MRIPSPVSRLRSFALRGEEFEVPGIVVKRTQQLRKGEKSQGLPAQEDLCVEPLVQDALCCIDK